MNEDLQEIRLRLDIVDYIGSRVALKRKGRNFAGLCPFHREKTPSFNVSPDRQTFHCFGCQTGGDIFSFAMQYENLEFVEALKELAREAGVTLKGKSGQGKSEKDKKIEERVAAANECALRYFRECYAAPAGEKARSYMESRGFVKDTLEKFEIGFAPDGFQGLIDYADRRDVSLADLVEAGLARRGEREGGYDFFRDRVIFPVRDPGGQLVGFGGRAFGDAQPKYLNTPETCLFSKSRLLYGMHLARELHRDKPFFMLMEGYTDVMMVHQHGVGPAVATLGTAMTEQHVRYVKRYGTPVYLAYDSDTAGQNAAARVLPYFLKYAVEARVVQIPQGKDPCEFLQNTANGAGLLGEAMKRGQDLFAFRLQRLLGELPDDPSIEARARCADEILKDLQVCRDPLRTDIYLQEVEDRLKIPMNTLKNRQVVDEEVQAQRSRSTAKARQRPSISKDTAYYLLSVTMAEPGYLAEFEERFGSGTLPASPAGSLLKRWIDAHTGPDALPHPVFEAGLDESEREIFSLARSEELPAVGELRQLFEDLLKRIQDPRAHVDRLKGEIKKAQRAGDKSKMMELLGEMQRLHRPGQH